MYDHVEVLSRAPKVFCQDQISNRFRVSSWWDPLLGPLFPRRAWSCSPLPTAEGGTLHRCLRGRAAIILFFFFFAKLLFRHLKCLLLCTHENMSGTNLSAGKRGSCPSSENFMSYYDEHFWKYTTRVRRSATYFFFFFFFHFFFFHFHFLLSAVDFYICTKYFEV